MTWSQSVNTRSAMCTQKFNTIAILAAACFITSVEAAHLSLQNQLQVALQQLAELTGGPFDNCCNVRPKYIESIIAKEFC